MFHSITHITKKFNFDILLYFNTHEVLYYYYYFLANYYKYVPIFFFIFTIFPTPRLPRHFAKYRTIHISGDKLYVRIYTQDACWNYTFRAKLKRSEDLIKLPQYILARLVRFAQYNVLHVVGHWLTLRLNGLWNNFFAD